MNRSILAATLLLAVSVLACGSGSKEPRRLNLYPSPTANPTQTPFVLEITTTPVSTYTQVVIEVTSTPQQVESLCVDALETVYLRPAASMTAHPTVALENGTVVEDLGGRDGVWWFVRYGELSGWVHSSYVIACNSTKE